MAEELILIDSNILIRWVQPGDMNYQIVRNSIQSLENSGTRVCYTSQNIAEFWNVLTRPANRNGYGMSPSQVHGKAIEIESKFRLLPDSIQVHNVWRHLLIDYQVCGVQVHDTRLVASMLVHGVHRILTFNTQDFSRFDKIEAVHPLNLK